MKNRIKYLCGFARNIILLFLSISCAHQVYPTGGLVDNIPPTIIITEPEHGSLKVTKNVFHFEFSEYIDRRSFEESVFISPAGAQPPEFDWNGKEVDIILPYELRPNKTHTITIGTDVYDMNNRNKMAEPFTLAFSTGDKIDSGFIYGKVYDEDPFGLLVSAFKLDGLNPDTLDPSKVMPDYTTRTNKEGEFSLKYLSDGKYRVYAQRDEYKNLLYDPGTDKIGMFQDDIIIDSLKREQAGLKTLTAMFDTAAPKLFSAEARDENHIILRFSKNIDTSAICDSSFVITDTVGTQKLGIQTWYPDYIKPFSFILQTEKQSNKKYFLKTYGIKDSTGRFIDPAYSKYYFEGSNVEDTIAPAIVSWKLNDYPFYTTKKDSLNNIDINSKLQLNFNDLIDKETFEKGLSIIDTTKSAVEKILQWNGNFSVNIFIQNMRFNNRYILSSSIFKKYNGKLNNTGFVLSLGTVDKLSLSSISGKIAAPKVKDNYYIEATNVETKRKYKNRTVQNTFRYENVPEGKYKFFSFHDSDSNSVYSYGNPFPYEKPENFKFHKDTIKVRARWPVELELKFGE